MAKATAEKNQIEPEEDAKFEPETVAEKMALLEVYHPILLMESSNKEFLWGSQFVGINEYKCWLPREESILVADSIMKILVDSNASSTYVDAEGRTHTSRRDDLSFMTQGVPVTAEQAHAKRIEGKMRVFPEKLPPRVATCIQERGFPRD